MSVHQMSGSMQCDFICFITDFIIIFQKLRYLIAASTNIKSQYCGLHLIEIFIKFDSCCIVENHTDLVLQQSDTYEEEGDHDASMVRGRMIFDKFYLRSCSASPNPGMLMSPVIASTRLSRLTPQDRNLKT